MWITAGWRAWRPVNVSWRLGVPNKCLLITLIEDAYFRSVLSLPISPLSLLTTAATATPTISICSKCGTIKKSGKLSCCGRGGSWLGNCGSAGNANLGHTWYEGIQACKDRQFQATVGQQLHVFQPKSDIFSDDTSIGMDSKVVTVATQMFASTVAKMSTPMSVATPITLPADTSIIMRARTSVMYDNGATAIIHMPVSMPMPKTTILPVKGTITYPANQRIIESSLSTSADTNMMAPSHTPASVSVSRWKITHVVTIVVIVCRYY